MSRFNLAGLFGQEGVSAKYRQHGVGMGYPVAGHHDRPASEREPILLGKGEKLKGTVTVWVRVFDLAKPDDLKAYADVRDKVANRLWIAIDRRFWTNPQTGDMKVFLEWAVPEYVKPPTPTTTPPAEFQSAAAREGSASW